MQPGIGGGVEGEQGDTGDDLSGPSEPGVSDPLAMEFSLRAMKTGGFCHLLCGEC